MGCGDEAGTLECDARTDKQACVFSVRDGGFDAMRMNQLITSAAVVVATWAVGGGLLAQQAPAPQPASPAVKAKANSPAMAQAEATVAKFRDLIRPQPGEYVTNIAKIA